MNIVSDETNPKKRNQTSKILIQTYLLLFVYIIFCVLYTLYVIYKAIYT